MFERFTNRTRRLIAGAADQAVALGDRTIQPEHVLLSVLTDPVAIATRVLSAHAVTAEAVLKEMRQMRVTALESIGIDIPAVEAAVEDAFGEGALAAGRANGKVRLAPPSKRLLELSLRHALDLDHRYIGTEHLLLAMHSLGAGPASAVIRSAVPRLDTLTTEVLAEIERDRSTASGG